MSTAPVAQMISVIIPHSGSRLVLADLLTSIGLQVCTVPVEVLVVCNGGTKPFPIGCENFELRWLNSAPGANSARQSGSEQARGLIFLFLDDDCRLNDPHLLQWHWDWHQRHQNESGVGGSYTLSLPASKWAQTYWHLQREWVREYQKPDGSCYHLLGGHFSLKSAVFAELSFDTSIIFGGTETEFQVRLAHRGYRLFYAPHQQVIHRGELTFKNFLIKAFKQGMGHGYIQSQHRRPPKYLYFSKTKVSPLHPFAENLYKFVFSVGEKYFSKTKQLKISRARLNWEILKASPRFCAGSFRFSELKRLRKLMAIRFF